MSSNMDKYNLAVKCWNVEPFPVLTGNYLTEVITGKIITELYSKTREKIYQMGSPI